MSTISASEFLKGGTPTVVQPADEHLARVTPEDSGTGIGSFGVGVVKGITDSAIQTTRLIQGLGQRAIAATTPLSLDQVRGTTGFKSLQGQEAQKIDTQLQSNNPAEKAGKVSETIGEFLLPFLGTEKAANVVEKTTNATKGIIETIADKTTDIPSKAAKTVLGEEDTKVIKSSQNPIVKLFQNGTKKVSDVVSNIEGSIDAFVKDSKASLQAVKNAIPDIQVDAQTIADKVNEGITNTIQHSADYKGIKIGLDTPSDIINSGILKPEEAQRVQKVLEFAAKWKDLSARGVLNLKEALSNFYATGENYTGSNAIVRSIQRNLVNLVADTAPEIKPALKQASSNIDKTEEFVTHLLGNDPVTGESKVLTLARNLADKAKNGYKVSLVQELEKLTGSKVMDDLQGVYDYLQSTKFKAPGLQKPLETLKYLVKKTIQKTIPLSGSAAAAAVAIPTVEANDDMINTATTDAEKKHGITFPRGFLRAVFDQESSSTTNPKNLALSMGLTKTAEQTLGKDFKPNTSMQNVFENAANFLAMKAKHIKSDGSVIDMTTSENAIKWYVQKYVGLLPGQSRVIGGQKVKYQDIYNSFKERLNKYSNA